MNITSFKISIQRGVILPGTDGKVIRILHSNISICSQVAYLERLRADLLKRSCIMIQKNVKCWLAVKRYQRKRRSAITVQCFVRVHQAKR